MPMPIVTPISTAHGCGGSITAYEFFSSTLIILLGIYYAMVFLHFLIDHDSFESKKDYLKAQIIPFYAVIKMFSSRFKTLK